jgi:beta-lactam-binding protein with PASTA domain
MGFDVSDGGAGPPVRVPASEEQDELDVGAQPRGTLTAPDLLGMVEHDARRVARLSDLRLWTDTRLVGEAMWDRVLAQHPHPGASLRPGDTLTVTVGARPEVVVPDLRGQDEEDVLATLRNAGLLPGRRGVRRSSAVPEGRIVRTRPRAGATVPRGTRVAYVVAVAPEPHGKPTRRHTRRDRARGPREGAFTSLPSEE